LGVQNKLFSFENISMVLRNLIVSALTQNLKSFMSTYNEKRELLGSPLFFGEG